MVVDRFDRFTRLAAARGAAATAGLMREGNGDSFIKRGREQGSLPIARMAQGSDSLGIDTRLGYEIIDTSLEAPGPGGNRPAIGRIVLRGIAGSQPGIDSGAGVGSIGIDVAAIESSQRITAPDDFLERPVRSLF